MIENTGLPIAFETHRLRVFVCQMQPAPHNAVRDVFIAFRTDQDRPLVCATASVWLSTIDWAEVTTEYRREGFWTELRKGIEKYYGHEIDGNGATEEGDKFLDAWEERKHGIEH